MFVRLWIAALFGLLVACGSKPSPAFDFPSAVRQWRLTESRTLGNDTLAAIPAKRVLEGAYQREGKIVVVAYELASETVAFETMQKFRQGERLGFYKGSRFFTLASTDVTRASLAEFAASLQQSIP